MFCNGDKMTRQCFPGTVVGGVGTVMGDVVKRLDKIMSCNRNYPTICFIEEGSDGKCSKEFLDKYKVATELINQRKGSQPLSAFCLEGQWAVNGCLR